MPGTETLTKQQWKKKLNNTGRKMSTGDEQHNTTLDTGDEQHNTALDTGDEQHNTALDIFRDLNELKKERLVLLFYADNGIMVIDKNRNTILVKLSNDDDFCLCFPKVAVRNKSGIKSLDVSKVTEIRSLFQGYGGIDSGNGLLGPISIFQLQQIDLFGYLRLLGASARIERSQIQDERPMSLVQTLRYFTVVIPKRRWKPNWRNPYTSETVEIAKGEVGEFGNCFGALETASAPYFHLTYKSFVGHDAGVLQSEDNQIRRLEIMGPLTIPERPAFMPVAKMRVMDRKTFHEHLDRYENYEYPQKCLE